MSELTTGLSHALEVFTNPVDYPDVSVPQHVIERVVQNTDKITAVYLIRAAYREIDGGWASLTDAVEIRDVILAGIRHRQAQEVKR